jgi:ATP-dependent RNA circularization protein (DNA/RNA ligase family)
MDKTTHSDFLKFPRTHHLFCTSKNVDREDLFMDPKDAKIFYSNFVTIEEKIDGANLGFSIDKETMNILSQNRSHYVTSQTASQWKMLDSWIADHPKLFEVLDPNFILYGEWVYARHSVEYDRLPGYFIAFDIYDTKNRYFLSVQERNKRLSGTDIPIIKTIATGNFSQDDIVKLLNGSSHYRTKGALEGVYVRIDSEKKLEHRSKCVRSDFIQEIEEHWSSRELEKNVIDYEAMYDPINYASSDGGFEII